MPKKKSSQNAFYFFMIDYKKREEARGRSFPGGLNEVSTACSDEWKAMTPQQKGPYEARAKNSKVKSGINGNRYTSQGVPISLIELEEKRKQDFIDTMNDYIKLTVNMSQDRDNLINKRFYFIHVNWLCRKLLPNGEGDFYPVEFAISQFSLKNGVENTYHEIISIDVPIGYAAEAAQHAEDTHKIDRNSPSGERSFEAMYRKLKNFLMPDTIGNKLPPLYTARGVTEIVPGLLTRIAAAGGQSVDIFRVYSIETLFFYIRNAAAARKDIDGFPALTTAETQIQNDRFDLTPGIACDYHDHIDEAVIHCSLSLVIRWVYIICDFCCLDLDIDMVPGRHCPLSTDVAKIKLEQTMEYKALNNSTDKIAPSIASMTGVTNEHRWKTSARTYKEEQDRRKGIQPLQIIDHSKPQNVYVQEAVSPSKQTTTGYTSNTSAKKMERPLRLPNTKSYAMIGANSEDVPSMNDTNFPAIGGRGVAVKKDLIKHFPPLGRGGGSVKSFDD